MRILSGIQPSGALHMNLSISSEVENGATGESDMDGCAARAATRESGDERVKSLTVASEPVKEIPKKELRFFDSVQNDR